jgi:hypothetical protein
MNPPCTWWLVRMQEHQSVCMQAVATTQLDESSAALHKAQEQAAEAASNADRLQKQLADAATSAEEERRRSKIAVNKQIDEYKESINQVWTTALPNLVPSFSTTCGVMNMLAVPAVATAGCWRREFWTPRPKASGRLTPCSSRSGHSQATLAKASTQYS